MAEASEQRKRIGEILVEQGSIDPKALDEALSAQQKSDKRKLGQILISRGYTKRHHVDIALAKQKLKGQ